MAYDAYVLLRKGGYQPVIGYDTYAWDQQTVQSGYYRDTGWVPNQLQVTVVDVVSGTDVLTYSGLTPATGTTATPDEQAPVAPRQLSFNETRLSFYDVGGQIIAQFWLSQFAGWSESPPNTE